ncbi:MAG: reductase [Fimbriimonadaceae bacterium]|jgi:FMN reductase|nr:reductase [Fimbriimonadaceae bacterium]
MPQPLVVGLGGSLAEHSNSLAALRIAVQGAAEEGATTELLDIREMSLPMYIPRCPDPPKAVLEFVDKVHAANGMIWSSPLYHGTISGSFKNALDWFQLLADREPAYLTDKVIGLVSAAGGTHGLQAVNTMEFVVRALRGWAVPLVVPISEAWQLFDHEGNTKDERVISQLQVLGCEVCRASRKFMEVRPMMDESAAKVQAQVEPISDDEAYVS